MSVTPQSSQPGNTRWTTAAFACPSMSRQVGMMDRSGCRVSVAVRPRNHRRSVSPQRGRRVLRSDRPKRATIRSIGSKKLEKVAHAAIGTTTWRPETKDFWPRDSGWEVFYREAVRRALLGKMETLVAEFPKSGEESRSNSTETTMHGSGDSVEGLVHDWNQVSAYSVRPPNRAHVAAGQYLCCTSPSTSPRATKPIVRLSRDLFRLSPSTKHIPSGTFALG
ncbi:hypothetical protein SAMN05444166_7588 [Singulisphaera sp. GP187]|nr:hypothetical protein SAMN05444166_7588 [Singulisphaera sp. GP187]